MANSSILVLPRLTAPTALKRPTTSASYGDTILDNMREPQVVSQPLAQKISFCAMGTPVSVCAPPAERNSSAARACARLRSGSTVMKQLSDFCNLLILLINCSVTSTLENFPAASPSHSCLRVARNINVDKVATGLEE